jgi:protein TonB
LALLAAATSLRAQQVPFPGYGVGYGVLLRPEPIVYTPGNGVTAPILLTPAATAMYSPDAMRRKIQGQVILKAVVLEDGTVDPDSIKVTRSVDPIYGLDAAVVEAVKQWRFKPGMKDGKWVAVRISIEHGFALYSDARHGGDAVR